MQSEGPSLEGYQVVPDNTYGFEYAVYPQESEEGHKHSVALVRRVRGESLRELEGWLRVCHSVGKQLWLLREGLIYPVRYSSI
jgi:tRNA splicing endonuclease